jgi:uncharacterized protein YceH (UPF0502 family)
LHPVPRYGFTVVDMTAPRVCTLPTAERPLRLAEFESLFAEHLDHVTWTDDRTAVFRLTGGDDVASLARDLGDRESRCCSFFSFEVAQPAASVVTMQVRVPRRYRTVLQAMVDQAARVSR